MPRKFKAMTAATGTTDAPVVVVAAVVDETPKTVTAAGSQPSTDIAGDEATAMLAESIGKINMGPKMNNFMHEAGKIISNMLEARVTNGAHVRSNSAHVRSNSGSSQSLQSLHSNSSSNLSRSPMIVRKRFELDDFKDIDPTNPAALKPVVVAPTHHQISAAGQKAQPQVPKALTAFTAEMPSNHAMSKVLDLCDNKSKPLVAALKPTPPALPKSVPANVGGAKHASEAPQAMETVVFRNKKDDNARRAARGGELSTQALDRRSYIESAVQPAAGDESNEGPAFSVCVKALGNGAQADGSIAPMSPENEQVVSQLLKDGKRPICCQCNSEITKGPFITALGRIWCPEHFICVNANCRRPLQDIGFVEEKGDLYCEYCFEKFLAPVCSRCGGKIKGDCLNAIGKHFHPECFTCAHCGKLFGNTPFFLEDGNAYCEADWNELFTTKCFACGFPVEAGDRWVEALNHNYHSQCFNCSYCKQNLEGQSFYNKGGRPFCKNHAR